MREDSGTMNPSPPRSRERRQPEVGRNIRVLLYHRILPGNTKGAKEIKFVPERQFRDQLGSWIDGDSPPSHSTTTG